MSDRAIRCEGIGKQYRIGERERYMALRDVITDAFKGPFRRIRQAASRAESNGNGKPTIWALQEVSFEVKPGEIIGIIGRNGAGKSTLLKILSRITEPTCGYAEVNGRVGSLLEVGTGFHPELTGRENIFLNGAILGMKKREIARKFDEIVAFAEVERFIDTPVKRYSSGMYVRLAFSVAAHLDPDILVIDEVLAVGDAEFQKKCLGKMEASTRSDGRTVLFVSHNIAAVENLCSSAILLSSGRLVSKGTTSSVVHEYLGSMRRDLVMPLEDRVDRKGSGILRFTSVSLADNTGRNLASFQCGTEAVLILTFNNTSERHFKLNVSLGIDNELGQRVLLLDSAFLGHDIEGVAPGPGILRVRIPRLGLLPGRYNFTIFATVNGIIVDWVKNAGVFDVEGGDYFGSGKLPSQGEGLFVIDHSFEYDKSTTTDLSRPQIDEPVANS
jgi:lipopolysaccharide transport system ATP-binding protein